MSEQYKIRGRVIVVGETQEFGAKGFTKRQIVIETDDKYPQQVALDLIKDNCALGDTLSVGMDVTVFFNVRGREYKGKYYTNLEAWKLDVGQAPAQSEFSPEEVAAGDGGEDSFPF